MSKATSIRIQSTKRPLNGTMDSSWLSGSTRSRQAEAWDFPAQINSDVEPRSLSLSGEGQPLSLGQPLSPLTRDFFEPRFGYDFSRVRVHNDREASYAARGIQARAYTLGSDIFFGAGQYSPATAAGKRLLAHELSHTIQQGSSTHRPSTSGSASKRGNIVAQMVTPLPRKAEVQRAWFNVGPVTITVDFTGIASVTDANLITEVESRFTAYTGAADASAIHSALSVLTAPQQRWVLYALDLLQDNTQTPLHNRLNRTTAVQRLIAHAPSAQFNSFTAAVGPAEREALRVSGWLEVALAANLTAPTATDRARIRSILNPPMAGGAGAGLNIANFHARMVPATKHLIKAVDPGNWSSTGTRQLPALQTIGNEILDEAKGFFSPYADTSRTTVFGLNPAYNIGANIYSVTAIPASSISADTQKSYLRNRARMVGRNTDATNTAFSDTHIFEDVNFDGNRAGDRVELEKLITKLLTDPAIVAAVNRLIQHTGRQSGTGASTRIGLSTEYNAASQTRCQARWSAIDTLCHEVLHALAHPDFEVLASRPGVAEGYILREGFTEILGTHLFNQRIKQKAATDAAFKGRMEMGIAPPPCPTPADATIGYGAYGAGARQILNLASVDENKFRAAFFLGQVHLIGL